MTALVTNSTNRSILREQGLVADVLPASIVEKGIRNLSCAADNLAGRVEFVVLPFGIDTEEGFVLIPHEATSDRQMQDHARELVGADYHRVMGPNLSSRVLVVVRSAAEAGDLESRIRSDQTVDAWSAIMDQKRK